MTILKPFVLSLFVDVDPNRLCDKTKMKSIPASGRTKPNNIETEKNCAMFPWKLETVQTVKQNLCAM